MYKKEFIVGACGNSVNQAWDSARSQAYFDTVEKIENRDNQEQLLTKKNFRVIATLKQSIPTIEKLNIIKAFQKKHRDAKVNHESDDALCMAAVPHEYYFFGSTCQD